MRLPVILMPVAVLIWQSAVAQDLPRLPYFSWSACPFECCTYRAWRAEQPINTFIKRDSKSAIAYKVKTREWVRAVDGVVITRRYGVSKVIKPVDVGYSKDGKGPLLHLEPGELVYSLHYEGEGQYLFWYKGKSYIDGVASRTPDSEPLDPELSFQTLSTPQYEWWVKIKNRQGQIGWTNTPESFSNSDRCG